MYLSADLDTEAWKIWSDTSISCLNRSRCSQIFGVWRGLSALLSASWHSLNRYRRYQQGLSGPNDINFGHCTSYSKSILSISTVKVSTGSAKRPKQPQLAKLIKIRNYRVTTGGWQPLRLANILSDTCHNPRLACCCQSQVTCSRYLPPSVTPMVAKRSWSILSFGRATSFFFKWTCPSSAKEVRMLGQHYQRVE